MDGLVNIQKRAAMYDYLLFDPQKAHHEGYESEPPVAPPLAIEYMILRKQYLAFYAQKDSLDNLRRDIPDFTAKPAKLLDKARYCLQSALDALESKMIYLEPHVIRACEQRVSEIARRSSEDPDFILNTVFVEQKTENR